MSSASSRRPDMRRMYAYTDVWWSLISSPADSRSPAAASRISLCSLFWSEDLLMGGSAAWWKTPGQTSVPAPAKPGCTAPTTNEKRALFGPFGACFPAVLSRRPSPPLLRDRRGRRHRAPDRLLPGLGGGDEQVHQVRG